MRGETRRRRFRMVLDQPDDVADARLANAIRVVVEDELRAHVDVVRDSRRDTAPSAVTSAGASWRRPLRNSLIAAGVLGGSCAAAGASCATDTSQTSGTLHASSGAHRARVRPRGICLVSSRMRSMRLRTSAAFAIAIASQTRRPCAEFTAAAMSNRACAYGWVSTSSSAESSHACSARVARWRSSHQARGWNQKTQRLTPASSAMAQSPRRTCVRSCARTAWSLRSSHDVPAVAAAGSCVRSSAARRSSRKCRRRRGAAIGVAARTSRRVKR